MNRRESLKLLAAAASGVLLPSEIFAEVQETSNQEGASPEAVFAFLPEGYAVKPVFSWLRWGEVRPSGWLREQMRRDLKGGFAGRLDELCHEASSDIFAAGRNKPSHPPTLSAADAPQRIDASSDYAWWNGETEGNWRAGFVMLAYLSGEDGYKRKADDWVEHVLSFQDTDGYLGINSPELRYRHAGELWTQACLLRGLLAYAELSRNATVLAAVRRAVDRSIKAYREENAPPPWGQSHDLMISDVLERLYEITGEARYRDFALWLYEGWSKAGKNDAALPSLLDRQRPFTGHGVNTVENLRLPLWLWMATGKGDLGKASRNSLDKLERYSMPGGSVVGSEHIDDQAPDPDKAEFEYCATGEAQFTYQSALQKTGLAAHAERVERVFLNDTQGSRLPDGTAIAYLSTENRLHCDGRTVDGKEAERRNKYSPTHADQAVCCNPMATQSAPLYVRGMWMRHRDGGLAALLYGPARVSTSIAGFPVEIEEKTSYPFDLHVEITVRPSRENSFSLYFRDPQWSRGTRVVCAGARVERVGDFWRVSKWWKAGDRITLDFAAEVRQVAAVNGEIALQYGPLLYALPIPAVRKVVKTYPVGGFADTYYTPVHEILDRPALPAESRWNGFGFVPAAKKLETEPLRPWDEPPVALHGEITNQANGARTIVELVPLGNAPTLRWLTFPVVP